MCGSLSILWHCLSLGLGFPGGSDGKASACNVGDPGSIPGSGRSSGEGNGNLLQYSCLENPTDRVGYNLWGRKESDTTERLSLHMGFQGNSAGKEPACQCRRHKRRGFDPWVGKIPWRRAWQPTAIFLPGESPWSEEADELPSMRSQRVGHD